MAASVTIVFGANAYVDGEDYHGLIVNMYQPGYFKIFKDRFATTRYSQAEVTVIVDHKLLYRIKRLQYEVRH